MPPQRNMSSPPLRQFVMALLVLTCLPPDLLADEVAERALAEARRHAGKTLTLVWQAGLQAQDPLRVTGPLWEQLTGVKIRVIEVPISDVFSKIMLEHRSATGAYDVIDVVPAWAADLAHAGVLEPLDGFIDRHGFRAALDGIAPAFRDYMRYDGRIFCIPDDGDALILYYRKDLFARKALRDAFRETYGYELGPPRDWSEYGQIASFLDARLRDSGVSGATFPGDPAFAQYLFQQRFRTSGGRFFDANTMRATVNSATGIKVLEAMRSDLRFMPQGSARFNFVENLAVFLDGAAAMTISWPPVGRWAAGYGSEDKALAWVPSSKVVGKVGYAMPPGGISQLAIGHALGVSSRSANKELAWLFIQWSNSESISRMRVETSYTLRDPFRTQHYLSPLYAAKWPEAHEYLATLRRAAEGGLIDLSLIQTDRYEEALRRGISRLWAGDDSKTIADAIAAEWDAITAQVGVDRQRRAYRNWLAKTGAYPSVR